MVLNCTDIFRAGLLPAEQVIMEHERLVAMAADAEDAALVLLALQATRRGRPAFGRRLVTECRRRGWSAVARLNFCSSSFYWFTIGFPLVNVSRCEADVADRCPPPTTSRLVTSTSCLAVIGPSWTSGSTVYPRRCPRWTG
jgi:hypothetical protein